MADLPITDRTRFEAQERLDKPDVESFLALADEALQRVLGAVLGRCGGVSSPPKITFSGAAAPQKLTFGTFHYLASSPTWTDDSGTTYKGWKVGAYLFSPSAGNQSAVLDISAVWAAAAAGQPAGKPYVYVRPVLSDMDTDGRRRWVGAADAGVAIKTRRRVRHEFKTSILPPQAGENDGWAPVVKIHGWSNFGAGNPGTPMFRYVSFLDSGVLAANTGQTDDVNGESTTSMYRLLDVLAADATLEGSGVENVFPADKYSGSKDMGLVQTMHLLRSRMVRLLDFNRARPWYYNPLGSDNVNDTGLQQLIDDRDAVAARPFVHASARVVINGGVPTLFAGGAVEAAPKNISGISGGAGGGTTGYYTVTFSAVPAGHKIAGVSVTPRDPARVPACVVNNGTSVDVYMRNEAGVGADADFYIQVLAVKT